MRRVALVAFLSLAALGGGCHRRAGFIGGAHAASRSGRQAELAAAAAVSGDVGGGDDDEGGGSKKSGNSKGNNRWRDTTVYVDGQPAGVLSFGELPVGLKPVWIEEKHSAEVEPGSHDPGYKIVQVRRYRFADLLTAMGVDLAKVREIHVMGPKLTEVIIASGAELRSKTGREFMFRFGSIIGGKAIPVVPANFGNRVMPDKIAAVMVYIDKKPPTLVPDEGLALDGKVVKDIPYFGQPIRGGIRIYDDDRLALLVKRHSLEDLKPVSMADGLRHYRLLDLMRVQAPNAPIDKVVEGWVIADEERKRKLTRAELETATVAIGDKQKTEVDVGSEKLPATAVALHSHHLGADELPQIRPEERD